jgi:hypothetical protein
MDNILTLRYDIPIKVSTNQIYSWMHRTQRKRIADMYHKLTKEVQQFETLTEKVDIEILFYFRSRYLDSSNCSFMWKMIEDSLVKNKLLSDDSNTYVWKFITESILLDKKERKKIEKDYLRILITKNEKD